MKKFHVYYINFYLRAGFLGFGTGSGKVRFFNDSELINEVSIIKVSWTLSRTVSRRFQRPLGALTLWKIKILPKKYIF